MDPDIFPEGHSFKGCNESDFLGTNFKNKIAIVAHGDCLVGLEWRDSYWNQGSTDQAIRSGQDCVTPIIGALWYSFGQKNVIQLIYISKKPKGRTCNCCWSKRPCRREFLYSPVGENRSWWISCCFEKYPHHNGLPRWNGKLYDVKIYKSQVFG